MFKKMIISMFVMFILVFGGALYFIQQTTEGTFGLQEESSNKLARSFEDESYPYFLTDSQIREAISKGSSSIDLIEDYKLHKVEDATEGRDVGFAYVEPPFLTVMMESRKIFDHYGRLAVDQELKSSLMDQFLPIHVRFYHNKGYVFDVKIEQGDEEIKAEKIVIKGAGTMKTLFLKVEDIDFSLPATILVEDSVDSSNHVFFEINFAEFIK